ncbi:MAG: hypothetical protein AAGF30_15120 [Pseudomonadota bacterium]
MKCLNIPTVGPTCLHDLKIQLGSTQIDLASPAVGVSILLVTVLGIFIFRSPA